MTRLHFLLLSFASAVAALLGLPVDREKRARRWLLQNRFKIEVQHRDDFTHYLILPESGTSCASTTYVPVGRNWPVFQAYMDKLAKHDFTLTERRFESFATGDTWETLTFESREIAPPTIHRFERPWWYQPLRA